MEMSPARTRASGDLLVVTDVDPSVSRANGFTSRLASLLDGLADALSVDLLVLEKAAAPGSPPTFDGSPSTATSERTASTRRTLRTAPIARDPLLERSPLGSVRRLWHYSVGGRPAGSYPRAVPLLNSLLAANRYRLLVYYLPQTAHLALGRHGAKQLCVLEEAIERRYLDVVPRGVLGEVKKQIVARGEIRRWGRLYRALAREGVPVVAISDVEKRWYERYMPATQVFVLPHAVDVDHFSPRGLDVDEDLDVAIVGNFAEERNLLPALDVLRAAASQGYASWRWAIVGRQRVPVPEYPGRPLVTGEVADVRPFYERAKVVVVPTFGGSGVKTTLLQAWSMGRAVVATGDATRGVPADPGRNLLMASTPDEIVTRCGQLLESPELRRQLGQGGRRTAERERDSRAVAERFRRLCLEIVGGD